ncbi:sulfotransferase [Photobacterium galatheae]|uniref:sulfotransferase n=1 Tax=Photobacterium galatheae TaxID=1654360 RepID=UPI00202CFF80|nr:sulfotransferase [Photobacterium galatheae]MCM0147493.1 sulfotransferase [Photobacterium galatheae]
MARLCFLLGIMPRSGTNYFANLLNLHPHCHHNAPIYEDFLVSQSGYLHFFARQVARHWSQHWDPDRKVLTTTNLMQCLGNGLQQFLLNREQQQALSAESLVIAKTPSVRHLQHFFSLFPELKLLILVRDGRAVAESGVRSFDWDFEKAAYDWHLSARRILDFIAANPEHSSRIKLVKFESLLTDTENELTGVFEFLELEPKAVSMAAVREMYVSGSSDTRRQHQSVSWQPVAAGADFQPLERFRHWRRKKHRRYEWLAGESLYQLGYLDSRPKFSLAEKVVQRALDVSWGIRIAPKTLHHAVVNRKLILKTY